jgi:hypothetical protein
LPELAVDHEDKAGHPDKNREETSSSHGTRRRFVSSKALTGAPRWVEGKDWCVCVVSGPELQTFYREGLCLAEVDKCRSCWALVLFYVRIIVWNILTLEGGIIKGAECMVKKNLIPCQKKSLMRWLPLMVLTWRVLK